MSHAYEQETVMKSFSYDDIHRIQTVLDEDKKADGASDCLLCQVRDSGSLPGNICVNSASFHRFILSNYPLSETYEDVTEDSKDRMRLWSNEFVTSKTDINYDSADLSPLEMDPCLSGDSWSDVNQGQRDTFNSCHDVIQKGSCDSCGEVSPKECGDSSKTEQNRRTSFSDKRSKTSDKNSCYSDQKYNPTGVGPQNNFSRRQSNFDRIHNISEKEVLIPKRWKSNNEKVGFERRSWRPERMSIAGFERPADRNLASGPIGCGQAMSSDNRQSHLERSCTASKRRHSRSEKLASGSERRLSQSEKPAATCGRSQSNQEKPLVLVTSERRQSNSEKALLASERRQSNCSKRLSTYAPESRKNSRAGNKQPLKKGRGMSKSSRGWDKFSTSFDSRSSMDETIRRILDKVRLTKIEMRMERQRRVRKNTIYTLLTVLAITVLAIMIVAVKIGIQVMLFGPPKSGSTIPPKPTHQWMMDWNPDLPDGPGFSKPRQVPVHWESIYNIDYWLYHRNKKPPEETTTFPL